MTLKHMGIAVGDGGGPNFMFSLVLKVVKAFYVRPCSPKLQTLQNTCKLPLKGAWTKACMDDTAGCGCRDQG